MGKKSNKTTNKTVYGSTTTTNPYVTSQTNNSGTVTTFNPGTAYDTINNFVINNTRGSLSFCNLSYPATAPVLLPVGR